ncbi:hypothetical protein Hanom_Chr05g00426471 [Helianthus anomalus]
MEMTLIFPLTCFQFLPESTRSEMDRLFKKSIHLHIRERERETRSRGDDDTIQWRLKMIQRWRWWFQGCGRLSHLCILGFVF